MIIIATTILFFLVYAYQDIKSRLVDIRLFGLHLLLNGFLLLKSDLSLINTISLVFSLLFAIIVANKLKNADGIALIIIATALPVSSYTNMQGMITFFLLFMLILVILLLFMILSKVMYYFSIKGHSESIKIKQNLWNFKFILPKHIVYRMNPSFYEIVDNKSILQDIVDYDDNEFFDTIQKHNEKLLNEKHEYYVINYLYPGILFLLLAYILTIIIL